MASTEERSIEPEKQSLLNQHKEKHFIVGEIVRNIIIGVSYGLTIPFALVADLSGTNTTSSIILTTGIAEVAAGAISMGLGRSTIGALCFGGVAKDANTSSFFTKTELFSPGILQPKARLITTRGVKERAGEIIAVPDTEAVEVAEILAQYGIEAHEYAPVVNALRKKLEAWPDFMKGG